MYLEPISWLLVGVLLTVTLYAIYKAVRRRLKAHSIGEYVRLTRNAAVERETEIQLAEGKFRKRTTDKFAQSQEPGESTIEDMHAEYLRRKQSLEQSLDPDDPITQEWIDRGRTIVKTHKAAIRMAYALPEPHKMIALISFTESHSLRSLYRSPPVTDAAGSFGPA